MKYSFLFMLLLFALVVPAQDSLNTNVRKSKNFGFSAALDYSIIKFESNSYFADSAGKVGHSNAQNGFGGSVGAFYNIRATRKLLFRPGVQMHLLNAKIKYDTDINHQQTSDIFPIAVEVPLALIYSRNITNDFPAPSKRYPEMGIGLRPVFPVTAFNDLHPTFKNFNLNLDVSVGFPFRMKKGTLRTELFYSYGFFNLIGNDPKDYKTYTVTYVGRSFAGLRIYFN